MQQLLSYGNQLENDNENVSSLSLTVEHRLYKDNHSDQATAC